eukprot:m.143140 g.143140  ORF g.143140 m.143140 type:complete len:521 (-) comp30294_c0_seq1:150-1712(-)
MIHIYIFGLSLGFILAAFVVGLSLGMISSSMTQRKAKSMNGLVVPLIIVIFIIVARFDNSEDDGPTGLEGRYDVDVDVESPNEEQREEQSESLVHQIDGSDPNDRIHIIFSSSCSDFQQWQSELLFYTHNQIGQKGRVTRLVSGCTSHGDNKGGFAYLPGKSVKDVSVLTMSTNPAAMVHMTPEFEGSKECPFINKPMSVDHWVRNAARKDAHGYRLENEIVVLIDPDQFFLAPLSITSKSLFPHIDESGVGVSRRRPVAQMYGIGTRWMHDFDDEPWTKQHPGLTFVEAVCGKESICAKAKERDVWDHHQVGPPYMMHWADIKNFAKEWASYTPAFASVTKNSLYTEMWAYAASSLNLQLPHTQLQNFMVSYPDIREEAWPWIDKQDLSSCHNPTLTIDEIPPFFHMCHNYRTVDGDGVEWMFHKGHVPQTILECDLPLIKPPPDDFWTVQKDVSGKRNAFMICTVIANLNNMLAAYKTKFCPAGVDLGKRIRLFNPEKAPACDRSTHTCEHFYMIESL